jgi:hypothetical protein
MHGRPLELVNGLPSVGQGKVEGEVVLVAHRRRVAREPRRCKFLGLRAILHHEGVKYIIPVIMTWAFARVTRWSKGSSCTTQSTHTTTCCVWKNLESEHE